MDPNRNTSQSDHKRSFYAVRQAIGYVGLLTPLALLAYTVLWQWPNAMSMPRSISAYYHTHMGDVLVGALCAVGVFLITYRGYLPKPGESRVLTDFWVSFAAGIGALGVALLPTIFAPPDDCMAGEPLLRVVPGTDGAPDSQVMVECATQGFLQTAQWPHTASTILFFVALGIICLFLFPRDETGRHYRTPEHKTYLAYGLLLAACGLGLAVVELAMTHTGTLVFWLEAIGVGAFSLAWLEKGRAKFTPLGILGARG